MSSKDIIPFPMIHIGNGIYTLSECEAEIQGIVKTSGLKNQFAADFNDRIDFLAKYRERATTLHPHWFEKLKRTDDLFSMHLARIGNMRILYAFVETNIYLLCAFKEQEGGNRRAHSYKQYIPIAENRLQNIRR